MFNPVKTASRHWYLLTALLMFIAFPSYDVAVLKYSFFMAWIFLVPLMIYIQGRELKDVMSAAFVTGLLGNYLTYGWIGNFGAKEPGGYFVIVFFLIPSLSAFFTIKFIAAEFLSRKFRKLRVFIFPSVWIIVDYIQSIGFLAFPWPYIGYSQYMFRPFIQLASVTGILGINFVMVMFNICAADFIASARERGSVRSALRSVNGLSLVVVIVFVLAATAAGAYRLFYYNQDAKGAGLKISTVQTGISPWDNWERKKFFYLDELKQHTDGALEDNPDLIIWSESATLEFISFRALVNDHDLFDAKLTEYVRTAGKPLLTGEIGLIPVQEGRRIRYYPQNNAVLINAEGQVVRTYPKINLVPFGEWFPYEKWLPFVKQIASHFGGSDFVPGNTPDLFKVNGYDFGALICYEGIFFRLCREYRQMGAHFLVNITNDGWTDSYGGHYQHFSASVFRAVENGLWVVRAGNDGVSAVIDPQGRITATMPYLTKGHMTGVVYPERNVKTFYSVAGDVILYAALFFIFLLLDHAGYEYLKKRMHLAKTRRRKVYIDKKHT
ncbi:MAG TPA: apolipoprotein N-acyltransferase [Spirochaetota bacterium]|nr:apolipoprotein N-acyltransferase [Spirochaetota bacterium]